MKFVRVLVLAAVLIVLAAPVAAQGDNPWESWLAPVGTQVSIYMGLAIAAVIALFAAQAGIRIGLQTAVGVWSDLKRMFGS